MSPMVMNHLPCEAKSQKPVSEPSLRNQSQKPVSETSLRNQSQTANRAGTDTFIPDRTHPHRKNQFPRKEIEAANWVHIGITTWKTQLTAVAAVVPEYVCTLLVIIV